MKKDLFNGKIKREFVSYIWVSLISIVIVFTGAGALVLYAALKTGHTLGFVVGMVVCLFGIANFCGTVFFIRKYPKYKKYTKWFLNSDIYFVDNDSKEYYGHWRGAAAFGAVTSIAAEDRGFENIKYPKKYRTFIVLTIIGIILPFVFLAVTLIIVDNIESLPTMLQNENVILLLLVAVEVIDFTLAFVFAFKVKKIREKTKEEYAKTHWEWHFPLYTSLIDVSVRQNRKKHKYWYDKDQLEQIEKLVKSASPNADLKLETNGNELVSFKAIDTVSRRVIFTGLFT